MANSLKENEYIWDVSVESKDDGHTGYVAYYTGYDDAEAHAKKVGGHRVQTTLWEDSDGRWYEVTMREVDVNLPDRNEVLKKLSLNERRALGIRE